MRGEKGTVGRNVRKDSNLARAEDVPWVIVSAEPTDTIQAFRATYFELTNSHVVFGISQYLLTGSVLSKIRRI
ncbi:MAG: hypothetical protein OEY56_06310 [Cyclobacteriaceae bacterium]|nr:hypothetical protein [Cyclobacteriaceae bacterium]